MTKQKPFSGRAPPKRTLNKQQAVRHLIHAACRMIAGQEDPFAIQLLIQSADKLLIDLARKAGRKLPFRWDEFAKPEYRDALFETIRETSNFFKHADRDHDALLHVAQIAESNILQLGLCILNYRDFYQEWSDHMRALFTAAKLLSPGGFVPDVQRDEFKAALSKFDDMAFSDYLKNFDDPLIMVIFPKFTAEKAEDLQDTFELYATRLRDLSRPLE